MSLTNDAAGPGEDAALSQGPSPSLAERTPGLVSRKSSQVGGSASTGRISPILARDDLLDAALQRETAGAPRAPDALQARRTAFNLSGAVGVTSSGRPRSGYKPFDR